MSTFRPYGAWFSFTRRFYKHSAPTGLMLPVNITHFDLTRFV